MGGIWFFLGPEQTRQVLATFGWESFSEKELPVDYRAPAHNSKSDEITVASWNVYNFDSDDYERIDFMAGILRHFDLLALQEINIRKGAKGVSLLADALSRKGTKWDYVVSDRTNSSNPQTSERYAYLWRTDKVKRVGKAALAKALDEGIEREPYIAVFENDLGNELVLVNCHLVPTKKNPSKEAGQIPKLIRKDPKRNWMILGDFNQDVHTKGIQRIIDEGYECCLPNYPTSLKTKGVPDDNSSHLNEPYDNIYFKSEDMKLLERGTVDFARAFKTNKEAKKISDHLPVWAKFRFEKK